MFIMRDSSEGLFLGEAFGVCSILWKGFSSDALAICEADTVNAGMQQRRGGIAFECRQGKDVS